MYFDDNTIYTYISDRYSIENAYTYEDGIIHFGNNGTLYYDAENGTLQGANGKSFYKDESHIAIVLPIETLTNVI